MSSLVILCLSCYYRFVLLPHYKLVPPRASVVYVQTISIDVARASPQLVSPQRFQVVRLAGRAGRATSRLIAIRTTTRTINRLFKKLFRFRRQIFRPRCRYFGFLFRYFGFLFTYFGFWFTYFGFPFRISVQRNPFISVVSICFAAHIYMYIKF
jgi:hypothetical protein